MLTSDVPPAHQHTDPDQVLRDWELFLGDAELEVRVLYRERAHLVAALSAHPGVQSVVRTGDPDATLPTCSTVVYFDTAEGQLSWHIADADLDLVAHVPEVDPADPRAQWDGHTTAEKYQRLRMLNQRHAAPPRR
jgi:hypothetical protein